MSREFAEANAFQRTVRHLAASGPGSWLFARILDTLDRLTFRATKASTYPGFAGYARRAAPRRISVFVLEPTDGGVPSDA